MHRATKIQTKENNINHESTCLAPAENPYTRFIFQYASPLITFIKYAPYCTMFKNSIDM